MNELLYGLRDVQTDFTQKHLKHNACPPGMYAPDMTLQEESLAARFPTRVMLRRIGADKTINTYLGKVIPIPTPQKLKLPRPLINVGKGQAINQVSKSIKSQGKKDKE